MEVGLPASRLTVSRLDLHGAVAAAAELRRLGEQSTYEIDFSRMTWVEPFGMLFFASQLRRFRRDRGAAKFRALGYEQLGYPGHMGFFKAFGLDYGKFPGEATGSLRYLPITELSVNELERESHGRGEDVRDTLEMHAEDLANVLTRSQGGDLRDTLAYSLREIFRNVVEHSKAPTIWYVAQYWPEKEWVELAILDEGMGIRSSLSRNPHLAMRTDLEALRLALLPGVSGVAFKGGPRQRKDAWANSGYGLYMTSQLCVRGGSFVACSGTGGLLIEGGAEAPFETDFVGTALRLCLSTRRLASLNAMLEDLRKAGSEVARSLSIGANVSASMSARTLKKNFSG